MASTSEVTVQVDPDACVGSGLCQVIAEAVFDMTPDGVVALRAGAGPVAVPSEWAGQVREAEVSCPAQAIAVTQKSEVDQ